MKDIVPDLPITFPNGPRTKDGHKTWAVNPGPQPLADLEEIESFDRLNCDGKPPDRQPVFWDRWGRSCVGRPIEDTWSWKKDDLVQGNKEYERDTNIASDKPKNPIIKYLEECFDPKQDCFNIGRPPRGHENLGPVVTPRELFWGLVEMKDGLPRTDPESIAFDEELAVLCLDSGWPVDLSDLRMLGHISNLVPGSGSKIDRWFAQHITEEDFR